MSLTVKSGGNFTLAPTGVHVARCYMMVDCGTQNTTFKGVPKVSRMVRVGWELPEATHIFKEENGPEPFTLSKQYTAVISEKSNLKKDLESWRGKSFQAEEVKEFSLKNIVGAFCLINVMHEAGKKDPSKLYAKISAIMPLPPKTPKPTAINDNLVYEIEEGTGGCFMKLPEWIRKEIQTAQEFTVTPDSPNHAPAEATATEDDESDCPF